MKYIYRNHTSKMATLIVTYGAGSRVEFGTKYPAGIAHLMEHCRYLGSKNYDAREWLKKIESIGGEWNANTEEDLVSYYVTAPEEYMEVMIKCLADIARYPTFPEDKFAKEQEVVCQEVRMYDDETDDLVHRALMSGVFSGGSLASPIIGTEESVRSITRQHLIDFNQEFYAPEQQLVTLCSSYNCEGLIKQYFGVPDDVIKWNPELTPFYAAPFEKLIEKEGQLQNIIRIAYGGVGLDKLALQDHAKLDVFNGVFGCGAASRLFLKIREDLGLVYGIRSGLNNNMDGTLFEIGTATEPENTEELLAEVDNEIDRIVNTLPDDEELMCAKNKIRSSEYSVADSSFSTGLRVIDEVFYKDDPPSTYLAAVDKVIPEDVRNVAQQVFSGSRYMVIGCEKQ